MKRPIFKDNIVPNAYILNNNAAEYTISKNWCNSKE